MTATATISDAQRDANRRNARLSTGPTTQAGKDASSRNAVRHGLAAARPTTDAEAAEHAARLASFRDLFAPADDWQSWLVDELAGATLRLTRIARAEAAHRADAAWRAENVWDEDRQLDAESLAAGLHRRPGRVLAALRRTLHGCEWLMARWAALAEAAAKGPWTPAQAELARDLLGVPAEFRPDPADAAATAAQFPEPARLARSQVARLQEQAVLVDEADEAARQLVLAGLADAPTRELAHLRRYERAAVRRLEWVQDQMDRAGLRPQARPAAPRTAPAPAPTPAQAPVEPAPPAPPRGVDRTKPPATPDPAPAAPEARPKRPDLAKFHRRNRRSA